MAEHIDHACEARRLLQVERSDAASALGWDSADAQHAATLAEAQVHATLALVEQQRIANDIAYVTLLERQYAEAAKNHDEFDWETRAASVERHTAVLARIREGLGLS